MLHKLAVKIYEDWENQIEKRLLTLFEKDEQALFLDLGCGDGEVTRRVAKVIGTKQLFAIEGLRVKIRGIEVKKSNLNHKFPFPSNRFDVVLSNFSIEHVFDIEMFVSETLRVLKNGGYAVIATENLASWGNIVSLLLGFQPFSSYIAIKNKVAGNPFAINTEGIGFEVLPEFGHNRVLAYKGLIDVVKIFGFKIEKVVGIGYLPFRGLISKILSKIDPMHTHLLLIRIRKP